VKEGGAEDPFSETDPAKPLFFDQAAAITSLAYVWIQSHLD
jgi:hypothetical protein